MNNLSEEEKQAIERIKEDLKEAEKLNYMYADIIIYDLYSILNLVEKQQKEIEEYKKKLTPTPDNYVPIEYQMLMYVDKRGYISKDKIREKIKELEKQEDKWWRFDAFEEYLAQVNILKELLEEGE